jgi:hypothetical protein
MRIEGYLKGAPWWEVLSHNLHQAVIARWLSGGK